MSLIYGYVTLFSITFFNYLMSILLYFRFQCGGLGKGKDNRVTFVTKK